MQIWTKLSQWKKIDQLNRATVLVFMLAFRDKDLAYPHWDIKLCLREVTHRGQLTAPTVAAILIDFSNEHRRLAPNFRFQCKSYHHWGEKKSCNLEFKRNAFLKP